LITLIEYFIPSMQQFHSTNVNSLYDAMHSSIKRIGIIQTNLDNINTVGFKGINPDSVLFADTLKDVFRNEEQGVMISTRNKLDLALTKANAYFLLEGPDDKPLRSRDGQFHAAEDGKIVDIQNRELIILDQDPEQNIGLRLAKGAALTVDKDGQVLLDGDIAGRIAVDYTSQTPGDKAYVLQGKLETSNVDVSANILKVMQVKRHIDTIQSMLAMELVVDKSLMETYGRNV
jgi:flagellar basal-body rod protein FlgF